MQSRPSWDDYFLNIAKVVSSRATCNRAQIGLVVVDADHHIIATGYNGAPPGSPHCPPHESLDPQDHCPRSVHAEANAIAHAAKKGVSLDGATWYIAGGLAPCNNCSLLLKSVNAKRIVWN